ncbi:uncharacterized protein LOC143917330 [Arctopsyche grandis]|uniref:uncharacterized protein LOC143917330 n=1 Tax=Arctopsyche grandis TaxID=121162 RepID=UPI00406D848D
MIRILQINLNGCQAAQDVMIQTAEERRADLVIVSEQYRNIPHRWYSDASSRSAIYTPTAHLRITNAVSIGVQGWTWVEMRGVRFYSCYFSPSATVEEFKRDLVCLEDDVRTSTLPVVVAGDFNSKAPEWGSQKTDRRGILLSEMASHLHLHAANVGSAYTFVRGSTGSVIDVTFAGETIIGRIRKWQVLDSYSHSDHRYIGFELEDRLAGPQMLPSSSGWGARKLDIVALDEAVAELRSKLFHTLYNRDSKFQDRRSCHLQIAYFEQAIILLRRVDVDVLFLTQVDRWLVGGCCQMFSCYHFGVGNSDRGVSSR